MARENPVWRSLLYVPANVERFVSKAHTRGADGIILDLEDSIPPGEKDSARATIEKAAALVGQAGADVLVRINRPLDMAVRDIEAVVSPNVRALLLPKLEGPDHVRLLAELVDDVEVRKGMERGHTLFGAMVESASAFFQMEHIAKAHPRVAALMIGGEDFALSVGMEPATDTLLYPKQLSVIAARAAGVIPLGLMGTVADYQDLDEARKDAELSRRFGMEGGSCIHPSIVPVLNEAFTPTADDVASAQRIVNAYRTATAEGRGSIEVDGHMIDVPVVLRAERLLERDAAIRQRLG
jgi:citrate lyase subunit beta/citryl-CoA lyase